LTNESTPQDRSAPTGGRLRSLVRDRRGAIAVVTAAVAVGTIHALVVAPRYHVGSFDDDGAYLLGARALAAGHGLSTRIAGGYPLIGVYPPGYPALIAPLVRLWPGNDTVLRGFSFVCFLALFPLTWVYLGRRLASNVGGGGPGGDRDLPGVSGGVGGVPLLSREARAWPPIGVNGLRVAVLLLLALNPVLATYASMVMPETSFVVVFLLLLLAVERWSEEPGTLTAAGAATVVSAAALPWLKEAGLGLIVGVAGWLLLRRQVRKAVLVVVGSAILLVPLLAARASARAALIGSRYSRDLGPSFQGGLGNTVRHVIPNALKDYVTRAVPKGLVPTRDGLLPNGGAFSVPWFLVTVTVAPLVVVGYVVWVRRHRDAASVAVPLYLAETLVYPFINERRIVLVVPVLTAWYALGGAWLLRVLGRRRGGASTGRPSVVAVVLGLLAVLVAVALVGQVTRDYLYFEGAGSSAPAGSSYMAFLRQVGTGSDVVDTDYLWTTAGYSGHPTLNGAYLAGCDPGRVAGALAGDRAAFVLTAELNGGGRVDDDCLLPALARVPGAVRLYRTPRDLASVYQLVGPGSPRPGWVDHTPEAALDGSGQPVLPVAERAQGATDPGGSYPTVMAPGSVAGPAEATLTWSWPRPVTMAQLSLGAAAAETGGTTTSVHVSVRGTDGRWQVVATIPGPVGPDAARRFILVVPRFPIAVTAARVTVEVAPTASSAADVPVVGVHDLHVLGPTAPGAGGSSG
jgi:hypothetical protein